MGAYRQKAKSVEFVSVGTGANAYSYQRYGGVAAEESSGRGLALRRTSGLLICWVSGLL